MVVTSNAITARQPIINIIQQWPQLDNNTKNKSTAVKQQSHAEKPVDPRGISELIDQMTTMCHSIQDKLLFLCENGDDTIASELMAQLLEEYTVIHSAINNNNTNNNTNNDILSSTSNRNSTTTTTTTTTTTLQPIHKIVDRRTDNCTLLHLLAQNNKHRCMEVISSHFPNIDLTDSIQSTPLLYAVANHCHEAAAFLLSRGANINQKDVYNKFPLLIALKARDYKMAELLASSRGLEVHLRGTKGNTVLHSVAENGDIIAVQFLVLNLSASPHRRNIEEETVLFHALPYPEICNFFTKQFPREIFKLMTTVNAYGRNLFHRAATEGIMDGLLALIKGIDVGSASNFGPHLNKADKYGDTPLLLAVKNGRKEAVAFFCRCSEVNINDGDLDGKTPLAHAIQNKNVELVQLLSSVGGSLKPTNRVEEKMRSNKVRDCCVSLQTALILIIALVAVLCVGAIAIISISFFATSISASATQIRRKSFSETLSYLRESIQEHSSIALTAATQLRSQNFSITDADQAMEMTFNTFVTNYGRARIMSSSYLGLPDFSKSGISKNFAKNTLEYYDSYLSTDKRDVTWYQVANLSNTQWTNIRTLPSEIRTLAATDLYNDFDRFVISAKKISWTEPYGVAGGSFAGRLFINFLIPLLDSSSTNVLGYYGLGATTDSLNQFLESQAKDDGSVIAIIEASTSYMIATSDSSVTLFKQRSNDIDRYDGSKAENERIRAMLKFARSKYGNSFNRAGTEKHFDIFKLNDRYQALNLGRLQDDYGMDWIIVQSLPMATFYRNMYISIGIMASATLILLVISVLVSFLAAKLFMKPILNMMKLAEAIKMLQLEKVEKILAKDDGFFTEIKVMRNTFSSMIARLKQFKQFIPDHILTIIEAEVSADVVNEKVANDQQSSGSPHSRRSSIDSSSSNESAMRLNTGIVNRALKSALVSSNISVMTVRFSEFLEVLEQYSAGDISETAKDLLAAMKDCIRDSNGQLVSLSSSKAVIVWNSFITQHDHKTRACKTANAALDALKKLQQNWAAKQLPILDLSIGISSGPVFYGNIGSDSTKFFTIIGHAAKNANRLCFRSAETGVHVLVSEDVHEAVKEEFLLRPIEAGAYELGEMRGGDEWVEDLNRESGDKWSEYRMGHELMRSGDYEQALEVFYRFYSKNPEDIVCSQMISQCKNNMQQNVRQSIRSD